MYFTFFDECERKIKNRLKINRVMFIYKISVKTFGTYFNLLSIVTRVGGCKEV